jgi:hypothetical protein
VKASGLARLAVAVVAAALAIAGCSSLIGVPDVPQPEGGGQDAGIGAFDASTPSEASGGTDAAEGTDAPAESDSATSTVADAGAGAG